MRWNIGKRLFAALTITCLVIVGLNALATRWSFQSGFVAYLSEQEKNQLLIIVDDLASIYIRDGGWDELRDNGRLWRSLFRNPNSGRRGDRPSGPPRRQGTPGSHQESGFERRGDRRPPRDGPPHPSLRPRDAGAHEFESQDPLALHARVTLRDMDNRVVFGPAASTPADPVRPIEVDGIAVGSLTIRPVQQASHPADVHFAQQQKKSIFYIGVAMLLLAAGIAAFVARQIVRPIKTLASGTRALMAGKFDQHITVARDDELGDLARDFNLLAKTLADNQQSRRQWVADISHELRTPLAILNGELQALEDGVRSFDEGTRVSLQAEVLRLTRLVADLHQLTISDEGGMRCTRVPLDLIELIKEVLHAHQSRLTQAGLKVDLLVDTDSVEIDGDSQRLTQLLINLIENSIRYTSAPGNIIIDVQNQQEWVIVLFSDSAPGVSHHDLPKLFERLYRVERSRNRATGGSGLGLSIVQAIVNAHDGQIEAQHSSLGGLAIRLVLPRRVRA